MARIAPPSIAACFILSASALSAGAMAQDAPIPDVAAAMLKAAHDSGERAEIEAVAKAVKAVFPDYADAIDADAAAKLASLEPEKPAEPAPPPKPVYNWRAMKPWDGKIRASGMMSSGNSQNAAVGVAIDAARTDGEFKHNFKGYFDLGESNNVTNQKRWGASYKLDYNFTDRTYAYARVSYEEDEFSGFDYRLFSGAGLGHYLAKSEPFTLKVEGGPGHRYSPIDATREVEEELAIYGASELSWAIREGVKFEQNVSATWTDPTTAFQSVTSLTTQLWGDLSTGLSFEYRYETDPPEDRRKTDTIARASLIYGF